MEKYIKSLSISLMLAVVMFFLSLFGAANGEILHMPQFITTILEAGANVLVFAVPLLYMGIFAVGMISMFKRVLNQQSNTMTQKFDKFPMVWFLLSFLFFMIYLIFVNIIFM